MEPFSLMGLVKAAGLAGGTENKARQPLIVQRFSHMPFRADLETPELSFELAIRR